MVASPKSTEAPFGERFLGQFGNDSVTLIVDNLPPHDSVMVSFHVYVISNTMSPGMHIKMHCPQPRALRRVSKGMTRRLLPLVLTLLALAGALAGPAGAANPAAARRDHRRRHRASPSTARR